MQKSLISLTFIIACILIGVGGCDRTKIIHLKSTRKLSVEIGSPLIMGFDSVGNLNNVTQKDTEFIYSITINKKVDLRVNATIIEDAPLIGEILSLKIKNKGTGLVASSKDTLEIKSSEKKTIINIIDSTISRMNIHSPN